MNAPIFYDKWSKRLRPESEVKSTIIDESRAVESRRRQMIMLDYYEELAKDKRQKEDNETGCK